MKLLKKATYILVFALIYGTTLPCTAQKSTTRTTLQKHAPFTVSKGYFQEWYAGIKVGGTGLNIFLPIIDIAENVEIDRIYFRNLEGQLSKKNSRYFAVLKNKSPHYTFKKSEKPADYPFTLKDNECVVSYKENNTIKYFKIKAISEVAGTYYENGPPSNYDNQNSTELASIDDEANEN